MLMLPSFPLNITQLRINVPIIDQRPALGQNLLYQRRLLFRKAKFPCLVRVVLLLQS